MIYVDSEKCAGCGICEEVCPVEAVRVSDGAAHINQERCNECEACVEACPNEAILVVIEPVEEEKALSLREQPEPGVVLPKTRLAPALSRSKIVPAVGAVLAFLGREVAPRLVTYLVDALDRPQSSPVSSTKSPPPSSGTKGEQKGRRRRHRRRGK